MSKNQNYYHIPGGFTPIFDAVDNDPNLTDSEKKVFCHIVRRSQNPYGKCTEGLAAMALFLKFSEGWVKKKITSLRKKNYIDRSGNGRNRKLWPIQLYGGTAHGDIVEEPLPVYLRKAE